MMSEGALYKVNMYTNYISVKDQMPISNRWVLVSTEKPPLPINIAKFDGVKWQFLFCIDNTSLSAVDDGTIHRIRLDEITHWRPIPLRRIEDELEETTVNIDFIYKCLARISVFLCQDDISKATILLGILMGRISEKFNKLDKKTERKNVFK